MSIPPNITTDRAALEREIIATGSRIKGDSCNCPAPAHDDRTASAGIYQSDDGQWKVKCHTGSCGFCGNVLDLMAQNQGKSVSEVYKEHADQLAAEVVKPSKEVRTAGSVDEILASYGSRLVDSYRYECPETGNIDLLVVKLTTGKTKGSNGKAKHAFNQWHQMGGAFYAQKRPGPAPILARKHIAKQQDLPVVVCEGESCCRVLFQCGFLATTAPGGSDGWQHADWSPLANRTVVLWPDDDESGESWLQGVTNTLESIGCKTHTVDFKALNNEGFPGYDCADLFAQRGSEAVSGAISKALSSGSVANMMLSYSQKVVSGELRSAYATLNGGDSIFKMTKMLRPHTITVFVASSGTGKSMTSVQLIDELVYQGTRTAAWLLEEGEVKHGGRLLAQLSDNNMTLDEDWLINNFNRYQELLEQFSSRINTAFADVRCESSMPSYSQILDWAESKAKDGCRVIIIDPISVADPGGDVWKADKDLMNALRDRITQKYPVSIIVTTHPKSDTKPPSLSNIAGGKSLDRLAQVVVWLSRTDGMKAGMSIKGHVIHYNREMTILKSREGEGIGQVVAGYFDRNTVSMTDLGMVVSELTEDQLEQVKQPKSPLPPHDKYHAAPSDDEDLFNGR